MNEQQNVETVRRAYEAFGRGDIDAVLATLQDDVEWITAGPDDLPTAGTRRGHQKVREFFGAVNDTFEMQRFEPATFVADGNTVVVLGSDTARIKATGTIVEEDWAHAFTFKDGKVATFREYMDTAAVVRELRGTQSVR